MRGLAELGYSFNRAALSLALARLTVPRVLPEPGGQLAWGTARPLWVRACASLHSQAGTSTITRGISNEGVAGVKNWPCAPFAVAGLVTGPHPLVPVAPASSTVLLTQVRQLSSQPSKPPPGVGKMAHYIKELGLPFTLWWTGAWIISGFAVYAVISSGLVGGGDAVDLLKAVGVGRIFDLDSINPGVGNLAVTIVINEALEVVRLPFVLATTPYVARFIPKGRGSLTELISTHGVPFLVLWSGSWVLSGIGIWGLLESGAIGGADAITLLHTIPGIDQLFDVDAINPALGNAAVAVGINECLEIARLPLCVMLAPRWARLWARVFRKG